MHREILGSADVGTKSRYFDMREEALMMNKYPKQRLVTFCYTYLLLYTANFAQISMMSADLLCYSQEPDSQTSCAKSVYKNWLIFIEETIQCMDTDTNHIHNSIKYHLIY